MESLLPHLQFLDDKQPAMLALVESLCNENSGTMNLEGLARVKQQLVDAYSPLEADLNLVDSLPRLVIDDLGHEVESALGQSIHLVKRPDAEKRVLLCIHMDTVYGVDHPFQECRMLENGTFNGPGVADAKGGLVVMLYALLAFEASRFAEQLGWEVLINPDEEIGSPGSIGLIHEISPRCDFGLLFEPGLDEKAIVSWRKGSGNFNFVVRGKAAHAGREFHLGRNAITAAAQLVTAINALNTDPEITFNVGKITGGGALNVVPDLAIVRFNVRVRTPDQQVQVEHQLTTLEEQFNQLDGIEVRLDGCFSSPPKPITPEMESLQRRIERCGNSLGMDVQWRGTGGASDGNKFADAGLPNIDSLGPCGGRIHSQDEFLIPESLVLRAKLSALILMDYAQDQSS